MIQISESRLNRLDSKPYRSSFMANMVRGWLVHQIHALREQRGWTQQDLGDRCGKPQSTIARLESREHAGWTVKTLIEIAQAFDVALQVRFVSWPRFLKDAENTSIEAMQVESWGKDQFLRCETQTSTNTPQILAFTYSIKSAFPDHSILPKVKISDALTPASIATNSGNIGSMLKAG